APHLSAGPLADAGGRRRVCGRSPHLSREISCEGGPPKSVKVAIHQPQYFPWPPYVHKVMSVDIFVYLDTVQFSKNGLQNRNQIKTSQGPLWLTVPVKHQLGRSIYETEIAEHRAIEKHWKTVAASYGRTAGFERWGNELQALLTT